MRFAPLALILFLSSECLSQGSTGKPDPPEKNYWIPALEIVGFDFALNRFNNRFIDRESFDVSGASIRKNLRAHWVVDNDEFSTNQFLHPYQGSVYHAAARSTGQGYWTAAAYTFAGSALWEIAGEVTPPATNDQIASGIGGTFFGESLFRMAGLTLDSRNGLPRLWRVLGATAVSPATGFNHFLFGERFDPILPEIEPAISARWNFGATVADHRVEGTSTRRQRHEAIADFSIGYGLPGDPDYSYQRPFDYFNFEFTAASNNAVESIMTRGLLAGDGYEAGENYRGVWGLYGTYDYMAPQIFRVSSTGLAAGTTGLLKLSGPVAIQGTALAGVGYGAAGTLEPIVGDGDYHYGLTPQGLLSFRFLFGNAASIDLSGRGYQITRTLSTNGRGWENIGRGEAGVTVRLFGPHAVSVKYRLTARDAHYSDLGKRDQRRGTVGIFYTVMKERP